MPSMVPREVGVARLTPVMIACLAAGACGSRAASPPRPDEGEGRPPDTVRNSIHIVIYAAGFSSEAVATQISAPLEEVMRAVPGVTGTESRSTAGLSLITLSVAGASAPVRQAVAEQISRATLPEGVEPVIGPPASRTAVVTEYTLADPGGNS